MTGLGNNLNLNHFTNQMDELNANLQKLIQNTILIENIVTFLIKGKCTECQKSVQPCIKDPFEKAVDKSVDHV